jgi:hypothetical protein
MRKEGVPFFSAAKERLGPLLTAKASPLIKSDPLCKALHNGSVSMNAKALVSYLHQRDPKSLSRDKNMSSILRRRAEEILHKRNGKGAEIF